MDANRPLSDVLEASGIARAQASDLRRQVAEEFPDPKTEPAAGLQARYLMAVSDMERAMRTLATAIKRAPA